MSAKTLQVFRSEKKYLINTVQYMQLSNLLSRVLKEDENNGCSGYNIRSLYFDTPFNRDFYDRVDGIENRRKIRLRTYDVDSERVKLEVKYKFNAAQRKDSIWISKEDAKGLMNGEYERLRSYDHQTANTMYQLMKNDYYRPAVMNTYNRKAFIHHTNNIRITLDSNIRSNETNLDFFCKDVSFLPILDFDLHVLEVKYDKFLYRWLSDILAACDEKQQSASKYSLSRGFFEKYLA